MTLRIVADANMPLVDEYFSSLGKITRLEGRFIKNRDLQDADVLLVRSVTEVNGDLLADTSVKFVATATIGTDHIDQHYLKSHNIGFASAQGCNANSVAEYILSALVVSNRLEDLIQGKQHLAIVGAGNVGSRLAFFAKTLGFDFGCYDPPLLNSSSEDRDWRWLDWQQLLKADVISLHVPISTVGDYPTQHMFNAEQLSKLKHGCLLINSSRGAVVDNDALLDILGDHQSKQPVKQLQAILDVWEEEPEISLQLRQACLFASPHIAGYSKDGKQKGTQMLYHALVNFFNLPALDVDLNSMPLHPVEWSSDDGFYKNLKKCILTGYDLSVDSKRFAKLDKNPSGKEFDLFRKNYPDRLEFNNYLISNVPQIYKQQLKQLGFQVIQE